MKMSSLLKDARRHEADAHLDMTPLIDIIFIVVVFLLLLANAPLYALKVDLPVASASTLEKSRVTSAQSLVLFSDGRLQLADYPSEDLATLEQRLRQLPPDAKLRLQVAGKSSSEQLLQLMSLLRSLPHLQVEEILMQQSQ